MEYIPSKYTYSQVLEILEREKNKEKDLKKNYRYIMLNCCHFGNFVGAFIFALFITVQLVDNHITYLFPWEKVMSHYKNAMIGAATTSLLYLTFWLALIILIYKLLSALINHLREYYIKKGLLVLNKYGGPQEQERIKTVYENMEQFIDYITQNPKLTEKDFRIDEAGTHLVRTIHHMDGDEKIEFYFGPHLKEIVTNHTVLDFSKLDTIYAL